MKAPRMAAPTAPPRLLTLALFAILGCASEAIAAPSCLDFSATPFTIKIYNNSANYNIFPVVVTPTNGPDEWLQGGFQVLEVPCIRQLIQHHKLPLGMRRSRVVNEVGADKSGASGNQ